MQATREMVSTAEVAFIAGVSDRDINRLVDEQILPDPLFRVEDGRWFERIAAAFARFYFTTSENLTSEIRKSVISELTDRLLTMKVDDRRLYLTLSSLNSWEPVDWQVHRSYLRIEMVPFLVVVQERAAEADRASRTIVSDPEIMGGAPVFAGTRVPIDTVISSLAAGVEFERLKSSWPFLTESLIEDAQVYLKVHPRRGRPRRLDGETSGWKQVSRKAIRSRSADA